MQTEASLLTHYNTMYLILLKELNSPKFVVSIPSPSAEVPPLFPILSYIFQSTCPYPELHHSIHLSLSWTTSFSPLVPILNYIIQSTCPYPQLHHSVHLFLSSATSFSPLVPILSYIIQSTYPKSPFIKLILMLFPILRYSSLMCPLIDIFSDQIPIFTSPLTR